MSHQKAIDSGIEVTTGEEFSRKDKVREFVSFSDILEVAETYSLIVCDDVDKLLSFPVVIGVKHDYNVFLLQDAKMKQVVEWLCLFAEESHTLDDVVIYYSGHGCLVKQCFGKFRIGKYEFEMTYDQEKTNRDSAYVVYDADRKVTEHVIDDVFTQIVKMFKCPCLVLSDCCHSGTIIDDSISHLKNQQINYISAARDDQYALQGDKNGLFTSHLYYSQDDDCKEIVENFKSCAQNCESRLYDRTKLWI